jgi:hypothetical protein
MGVGNVIDSTKGDRQADVPLMTISPWEVVGMPRSTWFALRSADLTPLPVNLPGRRRQYRIADLVRWVEELGTTTRRRTSTRRPSAKAA